MGYQCFDVEIDQKVAHITLNRPEKRNSMIPAFWDELPALIQEIDGKAQARVIVISSTGPHFCAGLDLSAFGAGGGGGTPLSEEEQRLRKRTRGAAFYDDVRRMQRSLSCLEDARIPVLAAIQGGAIGGGVDLVTACDIRYATEDAFVCIQEVNIGMTADVGTFPRLVKLIPEGIVRELAYTGRRMPAAEAQAVGLVNRVFADQVSMLEGVMEVAHEIAKKAPLAVYGSKRMINYARDHSTADGLDYIGIWNATFLQPEEMGEAIAANAQKREGKFAELPPIRKSQSEEIF
jgi:enoyl-CoA hydratase